MTGPRLAGLALLALLAVVPAGCGPTPVVTAPSRSRGPSINGASALAALFRQRGHEVRSAVRAGERLGDWADVLVRFAPYPGPPGRDEGRWMLAWLERDPGHRVVYVPHDFDAGPEFWAALLAAQPKGADPKLIAQIERNRDRARNWAADLPPRAKEPAGAEDWFAIAPGAGPPAVLAALEGPWAEGVDARAAAITRHETFRAEGETPLLAAPDGSVLAMSWTYDNGASALAVANGSFLVNAALLNPARRPLALRVVDWVGEGPRHVAFLDGKDLMDEESPRELGLFHLLGIPPFGWIAAHLAAFGLLAALARAPRLGRPLPEPPTGFERPAAHPEALGGLLARTGRADAARDLLDAYRRWRFPSTLAAGRAPAPASSPRTRVHRS